MQATMREPKRPHGCRSKSFYKITGKFDGISKKPPNALQYIEKKSGFPRALFPPPEGQAPPAPRGGRGLGLGRGSGLGRLGRGLGRLGGLSVCGGLREVGAGGAGRGFLGVCLSVCGSAVRKWGAAPF